MEQTGNNINILLVDDHQLVIDGIKSMLANNSGYVVADEANNGEDAFGLIANNPGKYQLVITDISMPILSGTELCKMIKQQYGNIQVLILSMYNNIQAVKEAINAEADGYILKNAGKKELLTALYRIANNGTYFSEAIVPLIYKQYHKQKHSDQQLSQLTEREKEILALIVKELTSEEIGEKLFISKKTVDNHRQHILEKTNCKSTVGLVKFAIKLGFE